MLDSSRFRGCVVVRVALLLSTKEHGSFSFCWWQAHLLHIEHQCWIVPPVEWDLDFEWTFLIFMDFFQIHDIFPCSVIIMFPWEDYSSVFLDILQRTWSVEGLDFPPQQVILSLRHPAAELGCKDSFFTIHFFILWSAFCSSFWSFTQIKGSFWFWTVVSCLRLGPRLSKNNKVL